MSYREGGWGELSGRKLVRCQREVKTVQLLVCFPTLVCGPFVIGERKSRRCVWYDGKGWGTSAYAAGVDEAVASVSPVEQSSRAAVPRAVGGVAGGCPAS